MGGFPSDGTPKGVSVCLGVFCAARPLPAAQVDFGPWTPAHPDRCGIPRERSPRILPRHPRRTHTRTLPSSCVWSRRGSSQTGTSDRQTRTPSLQPSGSSPNPWTVVMLSLPPRQPLAPAVPPAAPYLLNNRHWTHPCSLRTHLGFLSNTIRVIPIVSVLGRDAPATFDPFCCLP